MKFLDLGPGIHSGVPEAIYHERVLGVVSNGALGHVLRAPAVYRAWIDGRLKPEPEPKPGTALGVLAFGKAFHCAALEPARFAREYVAEVDHGYLLKHDASGTSAEQGKANKEAKRLWEAEHAGQFVLTAADAERISGMVAALGASQEVGHVFRALWGGDQTIRSEVTCVWTDEATGLLCRARPDVLLVDGRGLNGVIDLKSTSDASHDGFNRSRASYGYHRGEAHYRAGCEAVGYPLTRTFAPGIVGHAFVAVEKEPPYLAKLHGCSPDALAFGRRLCTEAKTTLARCLALDDWPGYPDEPSVLDLFPWEDR